ncbi:MAG: sodium/glutamate symporter [Tissierellia bacterium]|jgi:ESS family glutamate:Na+ symporter|nr:sodium/glutamate symporter [Tissierellia bacterium]
MTFEFNMIQTAGLAIVWLLVGKLLRARIKFFRDFAIPAPVIGGFLFAIINLVLRINNIMVIEFDETLRSFFMIIFFTSIGYNASIKTLKAGGPLVIKFLLIATILCVLQNVVAISLSGIAGVSPRLALMTGSTPMTGGHGTAAGIAPLIEDAGIAGAESVAVSAATFGLVAGSLLGGPIANFLIKRNNLVEKKAQESLEEAYDESILEEVVEPLDGDKMNMAFFVLLIAMFLGSYISDFLNAQVARITDLASFPAYIGPMLLAILARYISDKGTNFVPVKEVEIAGSIGLNIFLAMALMTMRLWDLADLIGSMLILLSAQVILAGLFVIFITYRFMGNNYDSAVLAAGHMGFSMGATPNGVANMESVCDKYVYSKMAFFVLPIVGGMFIDFANVLVIIGFLAVV